MNPSRERYSAVETTELGWCYWFKENGQPPLEYAASITNPTIKYRSEYMRDTTGFLQCDFNPCFHDKLLTADIKPLTTFVDSVDMTGHERLFQYSGTGVHIDLLSALRSLSPPPGLVDWMDDFGARAASHHITAVKETGSIINFIIELKDMCTLNIKKITGFLRRIDAASKSFFEHLRLTGSLWLAWNFAWKPFWNDIKGFIDTVKAARKRLDWLRKRNHIPTKVKYREGPRTFNWKSDASVTYPALSEPGPGPDVGEFPFIADILTSEFDCQMQLMLSSHAWVRWDIDDAFLDVFWGLGMVIAQMQRLYNPVSIAWEALPFSWLIDWFLSTRTKLSALALSLSPFKDAELLGSAWSMKGSILFESKINCPLPSPYQHDYSAGKYSFYCRQPGYPEVDSSPFRVPFEWYNFSILAALVAQFKRRGQAGQG
jgi:hypothetical protein